MASKSKIRRGFRERERGYVLMMLLLVMALMIIFAAAIVPTIKFEVERDREEEMIHRGVQYSRAIRAYYKKFGRYPAKIEDLENTNNLKFLRKRYKDPLTGQDFKLLHFGEVKMMFGAGIPGATPPGVPAANLVNGGGVQNALLNNAVVNSALAANQAATPTPGANGLPQGTDATDANTSADGSNEEKPADGTSGSSNGDSAAQTFGGMPIVGVTSFSKKATIREFNHKRKYNEWQFVYDPGTDRGGLLMTPNQPPLIQQGLQNVNGQNGTNGTGNGFGTGSSFGNAPGGSLNNSNQAPANEGQPSSPDQSNPQPQ